MPELHGSVHCIYIFIMYVLYKYGRYQSFIMNNHILWFASSSKSLVSEGGGLCSCILFT